MGLGRDALPTEKRVERLKAHVESLSTQVPVEYRGLRGGVLSAAKKGGCKHPDTSRETGTSQRTRGIFVNLGNGGVLLPLDKSTHERILQGYVAHKKQPPPREL